MAAAAPPPPPPPPSSSRERPKPAWAGALVFTGSSERDVALAKSFWSSVTLQPPLESRLGPRWGGGGGGNETCASAKRSSTCAAMSCAQRRSSHLDIDKGVFPSRPSVTVDKKEEAPQKDVEAERSDEKRKYLEKAKKREEIIALLRKQREERIMKEMISLRHKPKTKTQERMHASYGPMCPMERKIRKVKTPESDLEDQESVKALI